MSGTNMHPLDEDVSGTRDYGRNVAFAWGGYLIDIIAGFVVPRLVSDRLGQASLGIWDFSFGIAAYFGLVQLTMGSSVIRYVACYRAVGDWDGLNRSASTIARFLRAASWLAFAATLATVIWIIPLFGSRLGDGMRDSQWVVLFLGIKIGILVRLATYGAVITGCHRWDLHNSITAVTYACSAAGTILLVSCGGGLRGMAVISCMAYVIAELFRRRLAFRVCPQLKIDNRLASWRAFTEQLRYGAKGLIPRVSELLGNGMVGLILTGFLGPASLAVFSRPRRLILALQTLSAKAGYILVPSSSSLQARNNLSGLQSTLCRVPAGMAAFAMPPLVVLLFFGDSVIRFWMGDHYVVRGLIPALAAGALPMVVQEPVWSILAGMNAHGRLAFVRLAGSVAAVVLLWFVLSVKPSSPLVASAWCLGFSRIIVDGIITPVTACRRLQVPLGDFYRHSYLKPLLCVVPLALGCWAFLQHDMMSPAVRCGVMVSGWVATLCLYACFLVPQSLRERLVLFRMRQQGADS